VKVKKLSTSGDFAPWPLTRAPEVFALRPHRLELRARHTVVLVFQARFDCFKWMLLHKFCQYVCVRLQTTCDAFTVNIVSREPLAERVFYNPNTSDERISSLGDSCVVCYHVTTWPRPLRSSICVGRIWHSRFLHWPYPRAHLAYSS